MTREEMLGVPSARDLFEIARPCFHYAPRGTGDGGMFEASEKGRLLMKACEAIRAALAARSSVPVGEVDALFVDLPKRIASVQEFLGYGCWRTCSGCYETEDGYPNGHYPHSKVLGCTLGRGCSECGGIGATWDDTDYEEMARFLANPPPAATQGIGEPNVREAVIAAIEQGERDLEDDDQILARVRAALTEQPTPSSEVQHRPQPPGSCGFRPTCTCKGGCTCEQCRIALLAATPTLTGRHPGDDTASKESAK